MNYLVWLLYIIVIADIGGMIPHKTESGNSFHGHQFHKTVGVANFLIGMVGMVTFNLFLRDKNILPDWAFWAGMIGFMLIFIAGMVHLILSMMSCEP